MRWRCRAASGTGTATDGTEHVTYLSGRRANSERPGGDCVSAVGVDHGERVGGVGVGRWMRRTQDGEGRRPETDQPGAPVSGAQLGMVDVDGIGDVGLAPLDVRDGFDALAPFAQGRSEGASDGLGFCLSTATEN